MGKKKTVKKDILNEEVLEKEVVSFDDKNTKQTDLDKSIEELSNLVEEVKPIDMTDELEKMKREIFEEPVIKEEVIKKEELVKKENPKTVKEKINNFANSFFGYIWNGMEYDN